MAKETAEQKLMKMMQKKTPSVAVSPVAKKKLKFSFSIATLNRLLFLGILACIAGLVMELRSGSALLNQDVDFSNSVQVAQSVAKIAIPSGKTADFYLAQVNSRNIFKPYEAAVTGKVSIEKQGLAKRLSKYKLVGIAWLDLPETASVMIEEPTTKATYFLKQGEQLEGVTVKTIYTDRAVFSYENEETTIKL